MAGMGLAAPPGLRPRPGLWLHIGTQLSYGAVTRWAGGNMEPAGAEVIGTEAERKRSVPSAECKSFPCFSLG